MKRLPFSIKRPYTFGHCDYGRTFTESRRNAPNFGDKAGMALSAGLMSSAAEILVKWNEFKDQRHLVILCATEGELAAYR